jgi:threonine aldolase
LRQLVRSQINLEFVYWLSPVKNLFLIKLHHVARAELGAAAAFSGITTRTFPSIKGKLVAQTALDLAHPDAGPYLVSTKALAVEDTHNFGGGTVQSIDEIKKLHAGAQELGLPLHMDGAGILECTCCIWHAICRIR